MDQPWWGGLDISGPSAAVKSVWAAPDIGGTTGFRTQLARSPAPPQQAPAGGASHTTTKSLIATAGASKKIGRGSKRARECFSMISRKAEIVGRLRAGGTADRRIGDVRNRRHEMTSMKPMRLRKSMEPCRRSGNRTSSRHTSTGSPIWQGRRATSRGVLQGRTSNLF